MSKVILFLSSYKIGATNQLVQRACILNEHAPGCFLFLSGEREQFPGLFKKLANQHLNYKEVFGLDDHREFFRLSNEFKKYVNQFEPNIVHVHTNWQLAIGVFVKYIYKKNYLIIYEMHGYRHNYKLKSIIVRYLIGVSLYFFSEKVITQSSFLKNKFNFLGDKNIKIVYGLENEIFNKYQLPSFNGMKRIIFPGEFRKGKNQELLIRVIKNYIDRTGDKNIELYLPGRGEKLEECRNHVINFKLGEHIFFPGFLERSQMLDLYLKCQFAIIPTNTETFGLCIAEPFALGRVVISKPVGIAEDIIIHGETGFLWEKEKELLDILINILPNKEKCKYVSNNAFKNRNIFRLDKICNQYLEIIDSL